MKKTVNTRDKILNAAVKVLNKKEYHECPIDEIAKIAGIGKGTVYLYYKSKEELYYSILFKLINDLKTIVDTVDRSGLTPSGKIKHLIQCIDDFMSGNAQMLMVLREETRPAQGKLHKKLHAAFGDLLNSISRIIGHGIKEKSFKPYPPVFLGALLLSVISIVVQFRAKQRSCAATITHTAVIDIIMNGISL